jgi:hypothetical protein
MREKAMERKTAKTMPGEKRRAKQFNKLKPQGSARCRFLTDHQGPRWFAQLWGVFAGINAANCVKLEKDLLDF